MTGIKKFILFLLFVLFIFYSNTLILEIFGRNLLTGFICILNEETFRFISIIIGPPIWLFTLVLSVVEFYSYIIMYLDTFSQNEQVAYIFMRTLNIASHFLFLYIQYKYFLKYKESNVKKDLFKGYVLALGCHFLWNNLFALLFLTLLITIFS